MIPRTQRILDLSIPLLLVGVLVLLAVGALGETRTAFVTDWLSREGGAVLNWWLLATLAGAAVFPLLFRFMPSLPSRGYALARTAGLMLTGFIFWFLASMGFLTNTTGSMIFAWLVVIALSALAWTRRRDPEGISLEAWFKDNWVLVVVVEILFAAMLLGWAAYRAHEPEIRSTEKPMEMMFINSIRQSERFPPHDGWLAGYSISYYYFGYVIAAGLADLSGVNTGIAFGLIGPLLFALAGIGVLGVVYDLVRARPLPDRPGGSQAAGLAAGLLGAFFLTLMGNLGTFFIELPWNGSASSVASMAYFEFWDVPERSDLIIASEVNGVTQWVDTWGNPVELNPEIPPEDQGYFPVRDGNQNGEADFSESEISSREFKNWGYWWWFRYSRVVKDRFLDRTITNADGEQEVIKGRPIGVQPIDEFPHFSFVLSDIHPHVLALPFTLLAVGLTVGLALSSRDLEWWGYVLLAIWVGGLIFMNSWDAVFLPLLFGGEALRRLLRNGDGRLTSRDWGYVAIFALVIGVLTVGLYLPWILSFTSQASGFYPNIIWPTLPQQLFLQFGGFFLLLIPFLVREFIMGRQRINWQAAAGAFVLLFVTIVVVLPFAAASLNLALCNEESLPRSKACEVRDIVLGGVTPDNSETFWQDLLERRAPSYLSQGLILLALVIITFYLFARPSHKTKIADDGEPLPPYTRSNAVALLIIAAGLVLIFAPDFVYLVDNFSVRINTVFKLYYQGWILFSVAGAYAMYAILADAGQVKVLPEAVQLARIPVSTGLRVAFAALLALVIWMGLFYPLYAARTRGLNEAGRYTANRAYDACLDAAEDQFEGDALEQAKEDCLDQVTALTLDGRSRSIPEDEYTVAQCLLNLKPEPGSIVAEAPFEGGYNPTYGRVAMLTGVPNLLGWQNHERQWRGDTYDQVTDTVKAANGAVVDNRHLQLDRLYQSDSWEIAQQVIDRYGIDFVMVGQAEYSRYADYPQGLAKFADYLNPVCQSGNVALYQVN